MSENQTFEFTAKQWEAIDLLSGDATHNMLYGGSRSGKTVLLTKAIINRAQKVKSRHVILRSCFNHIKTSVWMDTIPKVINLCFKDSGITEVKSDYYLKVPSADGGMSEVWVAGLDDAKRTEKILGKEYSTIFFNECSQLDYKSITIAITRLAEKNSLKKKVYYDENPPSKRHWSYWLFLKGIDPQDSIPIDDPSDYVSMLLNPQDNIQNIDENYLKILSKLPEREKQRFLLGQFTDDSDGLAYYEFDRVNNIEEIPKRDGSILIGMDFNVNPMTAVIAQVFNDVIYVFDEVFLTNSDTPKMCSELFKKNYVGDVFPDSTGKNRKTSGKSDFIILKESGFNIKSVHNPIVFDRVNNLNRLFKAGRIKIDPRCKKLINDLEKVCWVDNELDERGDPMITHISDALGYLAWNLYPISQIENRLTLGSSR